MRIKTRHIVHCIVAAFVLLLAATSCTKDGQEKLILGTWETEKVTATLSVLGNTHEIESYKDIVDVILKYAGSMISEEDKKELEEAIKQDIEDLDKGLFSEEEAFRMELKEDDTASFQLLSDSGEWENALEGEYVFENERLTLYIQDEDQIHQVPMAIESLTRKKMAASIDAAAIIDTKATVPAGLSVYSLILNVSFRKIPVSRTRK